MLELGVFLVDYFFVVLGLVLTFSELESDLDSESLHRLKSDGILSSESESESDSVSLHRFKSDGISSNSSSSYITDCSFFLLVLFNSGILNTLSLFLNRLRCVGIVSVLQI